MNIRKRAFIVILGIILFISGFVSAVVLLRSDNDMSPSPAWFISARQTWNVNFREHNKPATAVALNNLKIVFHAGPLYLAANDDFSAYCLFKQYDTPVVRNSKKYDAEIIVLEYPYEFENHTQSSKVDTVAREFLCDSPNEQIVALFFKNEEQDFYGASYTIHTSRGTVRLVDTRGFGFWDILEDGINGHTYDSVGLCWVERNDEGAGCPIHHYSAPERDESEDEIEPQ